MAYTKEEHENLLKEIAESGGDTPKMLELMQKLRDDFDEREGMLRKLGESKDSERPEGQEAEEEKIRAESRQDDKEDGGERRRAYGALDGDTVSRAEYEALRKKYIDRFFSSPGEYRRDEKEEEAEEPRKKTFDDLWK